MRERTVYLVTKEIRFCYGHRLLHYDGECRHLHGHNGLIASKWRVEVSRRGNNLEKKWKS